MLCRASEAEIERVATISPAARNAARTIGTAPAAINTTSSTSTPTEIAIRSSRTGRADWMLLTR